MKTNSNLARRIALCGLFKTASLAAAALSTVTGFFIAGNSPLGAAACAVITTAALVTQRHLHFKRAPLREQLFHDVFVVPIARRFERAERLGLLSVDPDVRVIGLEQPAVAEKRVLQAA